MNELDAKSKTLNEYKEKIDDLRVRVLPIYPLCANPHKTRSFATVMFATAHGRHAHTCPWSHALGVSRTAMLQAVRRYAGVICLTLDSPIPIDLLQHPPEEE